jgi:hypothetical protein
MSTRRGEFNRSARAIWRHEAASGYCTHLCDRTLDHFHGRAVCGARRADSAPPPDESRLIERQVYFDVDEELANSFQMEGHEAAAPPAMP